MTITPATTPATGIPAWREQQAKLDVLSAYRETRPMVSYPAKAMQTVRDDLGCYIARQLARRWPVSQATLDQFTIADEYTTILTTRGDYWWTTLP